MIEKINVEDLKPGQNDLTYPFNGLEKDEPLKLIYSHNGYELYQRNDWAEKQIVQLEQLEYLVNGGLMN